MSGGFFRGTSAEQDTRFSNKQAKLLKTQKFAPELDHPVDTTKVKMDVIRPWIATRATELLGFEDEVLINFVYGLLDGKVVDGKQIQIQLTGFLEKNTGKFMKELWGLLLSAQNNASGVPQQFLDAKQEEMKKRQVESDRITQEIQKRKEKEGREFEQEKQKRMDVEAGNSRSTNAVSGSSSRHSLPRDSRVQSEKEREMEIRRSPRLKGRRTSSPSQSLSKSASKSGSPGERRSRSVSVSSQSRGPSISPSRQYHSPPRRSMSSERRCKSPAQRSISPRRRYSPRSNWSPSRRRSPYGRRKSPSTSRHRSPSPIRRRSPYGRRSPSSLRRRSPPSRRRSPVRSRRSSPSPSHHRRSPSPPRRRRSPSPPRRRRSPSPAPTRRRRSPSPASARRRRSPSPASARRRRSPSPARRRRSPSPTRRRRSPSPTHHRSPIRRGSLSPARRRRSLSPPVRRSPPDRSPQQQRRSPLHSPRNYGADPQMSPRARKRSHSPYRSRSPSYPTRRGSSRETDSRSNGFDSKRGQDEYASERAHEKRALVHDTLHREVAERSNSKRSVLDPIPHRFPSSRSSSRDSRGPNDIHNKNHGVPSENSSERSGSPSHLRRISPRRDRLPENTAKQTEKRTPHAVPGMNGDKEQPSLVREEAYHRTDSSSKKGKDSAADMKKKRTHANEFHQEYSNNGSEVGGSAGTRDHPSNMSLKRKESEHKSDMDIPKRHVRQVSGSPDDMEYGPGRVRGEKHSMDVSYDRQHLTLSVSDAEKQLKSRSVAYRDSYEADSVKRSKRKMDTNSLAHSIHSDSEETDTHKHRSTEKRRHKRSDKHKRDSDASESDSHTEDKKEAKKRRKDEKRLRREERRRKREEKHRKRLERHAGKHKLKSMDTVTPPSDFEKDHNDAGDEGPARKKGSHLAVAEEAESEEKKLEIELREKALESLRARKGIRH